MVGEYTMSDNEQLTEYEVHYQKDGNEHVAIVSARWPSEAQQLFQQQHNNNDIMVMCVLRHNLGNGE